MDSNILLWFAFMAFILGMLLLDLFVFNRKAHTVRVKEALWWSAMWIGLALLFNLGIYYFEGKKLALEFLAAYLVEKSLSVDNLFVFLLIFSYFQVPTSYQHKVLFWGIFGALVMRAIFIFAGIALIERFHWLMYLLGGVLIFSGIRFALEKEKEIHPEKNPALRLFRKLMPVTTNYHGDKLFLKKDKKLFATPLFVVLLVIETTDVIFAVDSVPAVLAISLHPFIVFSSNAFAILGLRALYFALSGVMQMFHHLHYGLSFILIFIGIKMLIVDFYHIPILVSLGVVGGTLILSVIASIIWPHPEEGTPVSAQPPGPPTGS
jgi:tellurite resistance protein TerC